MKKIIFSRKGFDSSAGGSPSIIFPDGTLFSIPIPGNKNEKYSYDKLEFKYDNDSISKILADLTNNKYTNEKCHYDPQKIAGTFVFGQAEQSAGHLINQGITEGDLFLFYGWFKKIKKEKGKWQYETEFPDIHLIWSYMIVNDVLKIDDEKQKNVALNKYSFLEKHPHVYWGEIPKNNIVYLSKEFIFFNYDKKRCLTDIDEYKGRATWRLPIYFNQPQAFSYLNNFENIDNKETIVKYKGYGQEFVLDLDKTNSDKEKIISHIKKIIK